MKKSILFVAAVVVLAAVPAFAATKTYQVTGPVIDMSGDSITVQKGSEKWEIAKGTAGVPADVKVGSKVTVQYMMTAESVVSKPAAAAKAAKPMASKSAPAAAPVAAVQPDAGVGAPAAGK